MQKGTGSPAFGGCTLYVIIAIVIFGVGILFDNPFQTSKDNSCVYSQYKQLCDTGGKIQQIVVTESQLFGLAPMYTSIVEITGVTDNAIILKAKGRIIALVYRDLYRDEIVQYHQERHRRVGTCELCGRE